MIVLFVADVVILCGLVVVEIGGATRQPFRCGREPVSGLAALLLPSFPHQDAVLED